MIILCLSVLTALSVLSFFIYRKSKAAETNTFKFALVLAAIIILSLGLEASVFNINFYTTHSYESYDLSYCLEKSETVNGEYVVNKNGVEFLELNREIENIKIVLGDNSPEKVNVSVLFTDEANKYYLSTPERTLYKDIESSHYITVASAGISDHLSLSFNEDVTVKSISINEPRPFNFSFVRLAVIISILLLVYIFMPSSILYKMKLSESKSTANSLVIGFLGLQCAVFLITGTLNPTFLGFTNGADGFKLTPLGFTHHNQYDELAQAILQGKTYIDNNDIPQSLLELENPYDTVARNEASQLSGDRYRWDVAYFNGHYYVYFGIVPLLLMYLPCRVIFDAPFPSAIGIILFAAIFALGVLKLLAILADKYFKNLSVGAYLLTALAFINCCGAMFLVKRPDFYSVPIICAMAFIIWGIYYWIKGKKTEKKQNLYFTLGSACCALAVGCRPQSVLMCAAALPLFWEFFFKDKKLFTLNKTKNLFALGMPFVIVASGIMYYNFIRFGSPFDFGSGYNLTTNDVTHRGFEIGRTGLGIFTYLFQTPNFTATFPYIKNVDIDTQYVGRTVHEICFGGLITCTPVLWFTGALPKVKKALKERKLFGLALITLTVGFATVIADAQAGGLLQRYFSDFGYIFFLSATLVIFSLFDSCHIEESHKNLCSLLFISTIFSTIYTICLVFSVADVTIDTQSPSTFGYIKHLVEFWL